MSGSFEMDPMKWIQWNESNEMDPLNRFNEMDPLNRFNKRILRNGYSMCRLLLV